MQKQVVIRAGVIGVAWASRRGIGEGILGGSNTRTPEQQLTEAIGLAESLGLDVVVSEGVQLREINAATLIGGGKVEEWAVIAAENQLELVVVDAALSPRQQRELEEAMKVKVLDRTGLILEIFASRARTAAGKMQVELAQLTYQSTRLVRQWTHLERQRGGLGKMGGPGERQIETDKRLLRDRISRVKNDLKAVEQTRGLQRMARAKAHLPTVALVGYTNAGKSTLFNQLAHAGTLVADALFATLDPLMRRLELPGGLEILIIDTVGFIADLPHELVAAFKATLEEVVLADVLLQVHDISNPEWMAQMRDVESVLAEIGADVKRVINVYNKVDRLAEGDFVPKNGVGVSAITGEGVPDLLAAVEKSLKSSWKTLEVVVPAGDGKRLAWLYAHGEVTDKQLVEEEWHLKVKLRADDLGLWQKLT
ncbi:MAG TPA: GTPase HflX [Alphaproteobacteria bacterium]|nr:GTPase HflX [Alphaproteobacteria bacterium]